MEFTIYAKSGEKVYSGDDVGYSIKANGVLEAWDSERKITYSPDGWSHIDQPRDQDYDILNSVH
jgi:hypothetical protein